MAVAGKNGIDLANIAKINDQTVSSGGAYDPVAGTGTYIETVPTSGLIKFGGVRFSGGILSSDTAESYPRYSYGGQPVVNFSCDEDGAHLRVAESKSDFVHITYGRYSAFGITSSGQMWEIGSSSTYMAGTDDTGNVFTQVTGVGDSDTGWTDVSSSYDGALAINSGKMYYVGLNGYGQAGTGNTTHSFGSCTQVGSATDWQEIAADPSGIASSDYGLSALKGSKIYFWGYNQFGGVINGTLGNISTATLIVDQTLAAGNVWIPFPNTGNTTRYAIAAIY